MRTRTDKRETRGRQTSICNFSLSKYSHLNSNVTQIQVKEEQMQTEATEVKLYGELNRVSSQLKETLKELDEVTKWKF